MYEFKVGDYIYGTRENGDINLGIITYNDEGSHRPYFMEILDDDESKNFKLIKDYPQSYLPKGIFSKKGYWVLSNPQLWKPKVGDYITITKSDIDWTYEMDEYIGRTLKIESFISEYTYFENPPLGIDEFFWSYKSKHYRPATKLEIEFLNSETKKLKLPSEGKVTGSVVELESVMVYLRSLGYEFSSKIHSDPQKKLTGIAWNGKVFWTLQTFENSSKPEITYSEFLKIQSNDPIKCKFLNYSEEYTLVVPENFELVKTFLRNRGGDRLLFEFYCLLKYKDFSKIPLINIIKDAITWDKNIAFVEWSIINKDWQKYFRTYLQLKQIDTVRSLTNEAIELESRRLLSTNFTSGIGKTTHLTSELYSPHTLNDGENILNKLQEIKLTFIKNKK